MKKQLKRLHTFISKYSTKSNLLILSLSCFIFSLILTRTLIFLEDGSFIKVFRTYTSVTCIYISIYIFIIIGNINIIKHIYFIFLTLVLTILLIPYWLEPTSVRNPNIILELIIALVCIIIICYYICLFTKFYNVIKIGVNKIYSTILTSDKHKSLKSILQTLTALFVSFAGLLAALTAIINNFTELWKQQSFESLIS